MNTANVPKSTGSTKYSNGVNPFARALAETEQSVSHNQNTPHQADGQNVFSDALAKTGDSFDFNSLNQSDAMEAQQKQQLEQQKREQMRRRLHDQINPVNTFELYNSREKKVKEEIDKLRQELLLLAQDVAKFDKQVQVTLMTEVVNPGQDGKYYITFFQKLRAFIMLLRQRIKSASTWATQMHAKKNKKKKGMQIGGQAHEKTSTVQDMMHHERSSQFSGG